MCMGDAGGADGGARPNEVGAAGEGDGACATGGRAIGARATEAARASSRCVTMRCSFY